MAQPTPSPADTSLQGFLEAAAAGPRVWAWREHGEVVAGTQRPAGASAGADDTATLLAEVVREVFGRSAAQLALRTLRDGGHDGRGGLPAALVQRVIADAEASRSLLLGAGFGLRMRYSALSGGSGFMRICHELRLDARALPRERRAAVDAWVRSQLVEGVPPSEDDLERLLRQALTQALH